MSHSELSASCGCGNICYTATLSIDPKQLSPRRCPCSFCQEHHALYLADPQGTLTFFAKDKDDLQIHTQGEGLANFLICNHCGDFIGLRYDGDDGVYGNINISLLTDPPPFGEPSDIVLGQSTRGQKIERWKNLWFKNVKTQTTN